MTTVYDIYSFIEDLAPYRLQEGYDNSGLNVGEMSAEVRSVLVALDCTAEVAREACQRDSHPPPCYFQRTKDPRAERPCCDTCGRGKERSFHAHKFRLRRGRNE